ncbi:hypothetical protein [Methylibium sp.]|uniref:hypothetical protein n=1 Tax=Methylibium sp. TaxID=2067992 RepID=UPI0017976E0B|nr:hypothetical protein [Methylibium sp.]MBA3588322.1 hypothetical protein [Methylibium sp.]
MSTYTEADDWLAANGPRGWIDELRKDAERYRWLRDTGAVFTVRAGSDPETCELMHINRPAAGLDNAIDAAMRTGD